MKEQKIPNFRKEVTMLLTYKERNGLIVAYAKLLRQKKLTTNEQELYDTLELSNTLNMTEINNIIHYAVNMSDKERIRLAKTVVNYLKRSKNQKKKKKEYDPEKEKQRNEYKREWTKYHYERKKKK